MKRPTIVLLLLASIVARPAAGQELASRETGVPGDIPRPNWNTLLEQSPLPSLQKDTNPDPPKKGIRQRLFDEKAVFLTAADVGISVWATLSIRKCRHDHGIGPCTDGGYGPFDTREALRQVQTGTVTLLSLKIKSIEDANDDKHKFWWTLQAGNIGMNLGVVAQNAGKRYGSKRDKD